MENACESPEGSPESPGVEASEEKDDEISNEYVNFTERDEYEDCMEDVPTKNFQFTSHNSMDGTSAMDGELDFEDEVQEDKDDVLKESLDEDFMLKENVDPGKEEENAIENKGVVSEEEDGQISTDERQGVKITRADGSVEEGEDDGEVTDEDDLEEGEVKDSSPTAKTQTRQVCRFFNRGQCTWGNLCRFLHLSVKDHGNYNMFAPSLKGALPYGPPGNGPVGSRGNLRGGPEYHLPPPPPPLPPPPPPVSEPAPVESAWERGLRHAKELIKKSTRRKEQEPDFEEKRLNLSLSNEDNDRDPSEYDKENEFYAKPHQRKQNEPFNKFEEVDDVFDNGDREAREHWRGGRYENFEIRWTRHDANKDRRQEKDRPRNSRFSTEREKAKPWRNTGTKWRDERLSEIQTSRSRGDEWRDPWRRSKTPKGRRSRSRGRSRGSYSSVSSRSYSERSSHSSYSYSRSTSHSSFYSSRSPSPNKLPSKRKLSPRKEPLTAVKVPNRSSPYKRKPIALRRTLSRSYTRSRSSHSLTHSRSTSSLSRTPSASRSRSRSYSRSLSMDSVSSASSSISHSSGRSGPVRNRNAHALVLKRDETKPASLPVKMDPPKPATSSLIEEMKRLRQYDKMRESQRALSLPQKKVVPPPTAPSNKEKKSEPVPSIPSVQFPSPVEPTPKEAAKQPQQKQQIKLTLLNKALPSKIPNPLKKELEVAKPKLLEKAADEKPEAKAGPKRQSPPPSGSHKPPLAGQKRSKSSRRDELLKQLKAVEDAIARKRAKFS